MAEQQETVSMDDKELFASAVADEAPEKTEAPAQTQEERARDEKGRFVAAEKEAQPEAKAEPEKVEQPAQQEQPTQAATEQPKTEQQEEGNVPSWRLRELREARDAEQRRADQEAQQRYQVQAELKAMQDELRKLQQPKQEPVDFFADPDKALQQHLTPIEQRFEQLARDMTLRMSRTAAIAQHGADRVAEMEKAVAEAMQKNHPDMPMLVSQMRSSDDPVAAAMNWYQRDKLLKETGGDLSAYKNKLLDEALKDPAFVAKAIESARTKAGQGGTAPIVQLPPSLNKTPASGPSHVPDDGDMSDRGIFRHAMSSR